MPSIRQLNRSVVETGEALPVVFESLDEKGVRFRGGTTSLIVAAPGVGKSVFALNTALGLPEDRTVQYFACDSDVSEQSTRIISRVAGVDMAEATEMYDTGSRHAFHALEKARNIDFQFPDAPGVEEVVHRMFAHAEIRGRFPDLTVIDNLMDMSGEAGEGERLNANILELSRIARLSGTHMMVLAHVGREYVEGNVIVPAGGILYQINKKPQVVLSLNHGRSETDLNCSILKTREGACSGDGQRHKVMLERDYSTMYIGDR